MSTSHVRLPSSTSAATEPRAGWLDRRRASRAGEVPWRHARAAEALHSEEDRMRLVAALLVLATLLVWILFLQA